MALVRMMTPISSGGFSSLWIFFSRLRSASSSILRETPPPPPRPGMITRDWPAMET